MKLIYLALALWAGYWIYLHQDNIPEDCFYSSQANAITCKYSNGHVSAPISVNHIKQVFFKILNLGVDVINWTWARLPNMVALCIVCVALVVAYKWVNKQKIIW